MEAAQGNATAGSSGVAQIVDGNPLQAQSAVVSAVGESKADTKVAEPKPVNLDDLLEFRKFKGKIDREREKERKAFEERIRQVEEQASKFRKIAEQNLRPDELRALSQSDYESELARERSARQELETMIARQNALAELSTKYDVPISELEDAENPSEAYERILQSVTGRYSEMNSRMAKLEQEMNARAAATSATPIIGGDTTGAGSNGGSLQKRYDDAAIARDTKRMEEIISTAIREGIKLDKLSVFNRKRS